MDWPNNPHPGFVWSAATLGPRASRPHDLERVSGEVHAGGTPAVPGAALHTKRRLQMFCR